MRGVVELISDLESLCKAVREVGEGSLLLEDWDEGLNFRADVKSVDAEETVRSAWEHYGSPVRFTLFNDRVEVRWEGELGRKLALDEQGAYEVIERAVRLNTDTGRFPGMRAFQELAPLEAAQVQVFRLGGRDLYFKLQRVGGEACAGAGVSTDDSPEPAAETRA